MAAFDSNGAVLATNNYHPTKASWTPFYFNFTADSTNTTLELLDTSVDTFGVDLLLDGVQVVPYDPSAPMITLSPTNETVLAWTATTFNASASGGTGPLTVQWYFGTNAIAGATNASLTINPGLSNAGLYYATFTDLLGRNATTSAATLTVIPVAFTNGSFETPLLPSNGSLSLSPGNTSLIGWTIGGTGGPVELFTVLDGRGQPVYDGNQWIQFNAYNTPPGAILSQTFTTVSGQTYGVGFALALTGKGNESLGVAVFDANGTVLATNNYQPTNSTWMPFYFGFTADSTTTTLELIDTSVDTVAVDLLLDDVQVVPLPGTGPIITLSPTNQTVLPRSTATFNAAATEGPFPLAVQWYFGTHAILGATNTSLTINPALPANAGSYDAVFTDPFGRSTTTSVATLMMIQITISNGSFETPILPTDGSLSLSPGSTSLPGWTIGGSGGPVMLYTVLDGTGPTAYDGGQWIQFNASNTAPGATLSQTLATVTGQAYGVAFALALQGSGNESLGVVALDSNGTVLATNNYQPTNSTWTPFYFNFTADSTNTTLKLIDTSVDTVAVDLLLDDVLVGNPPTALGASPGAGSITINFTGTPRMPYTVLASTDLKSWVPVGMATAGVDGSFQFVDTNTNLHRSRFYTATLP